MSGAGDDSVNGAERGGVLAEAARVDLAVYNAVADTHTPRLDGVMHRLSEAANYSRISMACAAALAVAGGPRGRRAAAAGLASIAVTSSVVNLAIKPVGRRRRPDRPELQLPIDRQVPMPTSRSFPSGHTAAAVAFASGVARVMPAAGLPLRTLAAVVGYSRVHTGVHYPGDVVAGAVIGSVAADLTAAGLGRLGLGAGGA